MGKPRVSVSAIRPLIESGELTHEQAVQRFEIVQDGYQPPKPTVTPAPKKEESFGSKLWGSIKDGVANDPIVNAHIGAAKGLGSTVYGLGKLASKIPGVSQLSQALGADESYANFEQPKPEILEPKGVAQHVGFMGEQVAEAMVPAVKAGQLVKAASMPVKMAAGGAVAAGTQAGQGGELNTGTAVAAGLGAVAEPIVAGAQSLIASPLAQKFRERALNQVTSMLKPNEGNINTAKGVAAGLMDDYKAGSFRPKKMEDVANYVTTKLETFGQMLDDAYTHLPQGSYLDADAMIGELDKAIGSFTVVNPNTGVAAVPLHLKTAHNTLMSYRGMIEKLSESASIPTAVKELSEAQKQSAALARRITETQEKYLLVFPNQFHDDMAAIAAKTEAAERVLGSDKPKKIIPHEVIVQLKRSLDPILAKKGQYAETAQIVDEMNEGAQRSVIEIFRKSLADEFVNIAELNAKVSYWAKANDLVQSAVREGVTSDVKGWAKAGSTGIAVGAMTRGGWFNKIATGATAAVTTKMLGRATQTPAWKMASANFKMSVADKLATGRWQEAALMLNRIIASQATQVGY